MTILSGCGPMTIAISSRSLSDDRRYIISNRIDSVRRFLLAELSSLSFFNSSFSMISYFVVSTMCCLDLSANLNWWLQQLGIHVSLSGP